MTYHVLVDSITDILTHPEGSSKCGKTCENNHHFYQTAQSRVQITCI